MTFPVVHDVTTTAEVVTDGAIDVQYPATVNSGDLLLLQVSSDSGTGITDNSGTWTLLLILSDSTANRGEWYAKIADGTEGGTTDSFSNNKNWGSTAIMVRISGTANGTLADVEISAGAGNNDTGASGDQPDPDSLTASWGAEDNLWVAWFSAGDDDATVSAYPSGYSNGNQVQSGGGTNNGNEQGIAFLESAVSTEDPGPFTLSESEGWDAATLVVRGTAGGGGANETDSAAITTTSATPLASTDTSTATDNATLTAAVASVIASTDTSSATDSAQTTSVSASVLSSTDTSAATDTASLTSASAAVLTATAQSIASDAAAIVTAAATPLTSSETVGGAANNVADSAVITTVGSATLTATEAAVSTDGATITPASVTIRTSAETASALDNALIVNAQGTPIASVESVQTDARITTVTVTPLTAVETTGTAQILLGTPEIEPALNAGLNTVPVLRASPAVVAQLKAKLQVTPE